MRWQPALAIGLGGIAGATVRWAAVETVPSSTSWPWATFLVNLAGCALLGWLVNSGPLTRFRLAASAGFCGSLTTFSGLAVEIADFGADERWVLAVGYAGGTIAGGLLAIVVGRALALR